MVKYLLVNAYVFLAFLSIAQTENKDVVITASGSGTSQELAKQTALRNAIEQAFGAFISSKTEIFNDEIVADQMSSVSSGNVKSYEVLNESQLPNGTWASTLRVIVSVDKLTTFVEAKGITVEIKGGLFALNIKQQLLNEQGEIKAVAEMIGLLHEPMQISFDYVIKSSDPKSLDAESKNWEIPLLVTATCNKNIDFCANYFKKTLAALSLSPSEVETYKSLNKQVFPVSVSYQNQTLTYALRKQTSISAIESLMSNWEFYTRLFAVQSVMEESFGNGESRLFSFSGSNRNNYDNKSSVQINFPTNGEQAATFSWNDKRSLAQIEQMTGYSVKPRGVVSNFKNGGYVVYEKDGHGLIMSNIDCGKFNWSDSKIVCDEWSINGYSDWHLPTKEELEFIYNKMYKIGIGGVGLKSSGNWSSGYWSSTEGPTFFFFGLGDTYKENYKFSIRSEDSQQRVRAVRNF